MRWNFREMDGYEAFLCELVDKYGGFAKNRRSALHYFVWIAGNQGGPTGVGHDDIILYYFL